MKPSRRSAFSLVEITLALGIMSFAFVSVFGLLPVGMNAFRKAMDTSVGSQIVQRVMGDLQQSDFDELIKDAQGNPVTAGTTGVKAMRYFDDQGNELPSSASAIYYVNSRIVPATALPAATASATSQNANLATVTVQVANNPGQLTLAQDTSSKLWNGARSGSSTTLVVPIITTSACIARNK